MHDNRDPYLTTKRMVGGAAILAALSVPAFCLSECTMPEGRDNSFRQPNTPGQVDDEGGPTIGVGINGKPGLYFDEGIGFGIDADGDIGIGFGF